MSIKYACLYKYETNQPSLIGEFPKDEEKKFAETMLTILVTVLPYEYRKQTIEDEYMNYSYFAFDRKHIVGCVTTKNTRARIVSGFLEDVSKNIFNCTDYNKLLKEKTKYYNDPANDKLSQVQISIENAKNIMTENVEKAMEKGDQLDQMHSKSSDLSQSASQFETKAVELKREMCWRNIKMMVMIGLGIFVVISIIVLLACKPNFSAC
jgi:vesicle-associated membrane protein 7